MAKNVQKPQNIVPTTKTSNKGRNKGDRPNIFKRMGMGLKAVASELKKVTWPSAKTTMTSTGVVLGVVGLFLIVFFGIDTLLAYLLELLVG